MEIPHTIKLFGSKVKGFANDRNDWDIAIYFPEPLEEVGRWPAFELEAELSRAVGSTVQVIVLNILPPPILGFQIVSNGVVLIDRDENLRMNFLIEKTRYVLYFVVKL